MKTINKEAKNFKKREKFYQKNKFRKRQNEVNLRERKGQIGGTKDPKNEKWDKINPKETENQGQREQLDERERKSKVKLKEKTKQEKKKFLHKAEKTERQEKLDEDNK